MERRREELKAYFAAHTPKGDVRYPQFVRELARVEAALEELFRRPA